MKEFFRWLWEPLNYLSRALNWVYKHPRHVVIGAVLILIVVFAMNRRGNQASDRGHAPPTTEPPQAAPRRQTPLPNLKPKKYTDAYEAVRDLEDLVREYEAGK